MVTKSLSLVNGERIRMTKTDGCGRPVFGEHSSATSEGFISVALTANTLDSDEINVVNAAGKRCVYKPAETSFVGYGVEITFCEVDPEVFTLVTGQAPVHAGAGGTGDVVGFDIDTAVSLSASGFALELWAGSVSGDACDTEGAQGSFGYLLLPFLRGGIVGDFTVENGAVTFTLTGMNTRDGNGWGFGPYSDVQIGAGSLPGPMLNPISSTVALRMMITDVLPPEVRVGSRPLLDPDVEAITDLDVSVVAHVATFDPTADDIASPFYYEFGDGTWDYIDAASLGATSHTYATAGTYTARASSNGVWQSVQVVIA